MIEYHYGYIPEPRYFIVLYNDWLESVPQAENGLCPMGSSVLAGDFFFSQDVADFHVAKKCGLFFIEGISEVVPDGR